MRIALLTPFATLNQEAGVIYLLANYLQSIYPDVVQLKCNGVFSLCDRDGEQGWKREFNSCQDCTSDQGSLANWSKIKSNCLSRCLLPRDIEETRRWINSLETEELTRAQFDDIPIFKLCTGSFANRFGLQIPNLKNKSHVQMLRRLMLGTVRMCLASQKFNKRFMPDVCFVAGGRDFISNSFLYKAKEQGCNPVLFKWDVSARAVQIVHPVSGEIFPCNFMLENIATMRPDVYSWSDELVSIINQILSFLDICDTQLTLPIAK